MDNITISTLFPSRFLRSVDLGEADTSLTINGVSLEDFGTGGNREQKAVVFFRETEKGLVLNKTNATSIAELYGDKTANWVGKRVTLFVAPVTYQGRQFDGIRVRTRTSAITRMFDDGTPIPSEPPFDQS